MQYYLWRNFVKYVILSKEGGKEEGSCCKTAFLGASHSAKALWKADKYVIGRTSSHKECLQWVVFSLLKSAAYTSSCQIIVLTSTAFHVEKLRISVQNCSFPKAAEGSGWHWVMGWNKLLLLHTGMVGEEGDFFSIRFTKESLKFWVVK